MHQVLLPLLMAVGCCQARGGIVEHSELPAVAGPARITGMRDDRAAQDATPVVQMPMRGSPEPSSASARGRRILSTAFVMVGPDGVISLRLSDGSVQMLRDVVMRRRDYCGVRVGRARAARFCGRYADVAAARPGSTPPD